MVMPGDNVTMDVTLIVPIAMEEKLRFAIREGGRTVGAGVVAAINDVSARASGHVRGHDRGRVLAPARTSPRGFRT